MIPRNASESCQWLIKGLVVKTVLELFKLFRMTLCLFPTNSLLWLQIVSVVGSVLIGLVVMVRFFKPLQALAASDPTSTANRRYMDWYGGNATSLRVITLLASFRPSVLTLLWSKACGLASFNIPVTRSYIGLRFVQVGHAGARTRRTIHWQLLHCVGCGLQDDLDWRRLVHHRRRFDSARVTIVQLAPLQCTTATSGGTLI